MTLSKTRKPVVAGRFYPDEPEDLKRLISGFLGSKPADKLKAFACMLPHAGYIYSGKVASTTLARINIPDRVILLGPNHTTAGPAYSIMVEGAWKTPLGVVKIDSRLAKMILGGSGYLQEDELAHIDEHSLEVELPLLQYFRKDFEIVPVAFMSDKLDILIEIGKSIAKVIKGSCLEERVLILASSDMTHYEPQEEAVLKDKKAIEAILALDEKRLFQEIDKYGISMCGPAPVAVMLSCAKALGAKKAELAMYQTSGEITGDKTSVVGYAGMIVN